MARYDYTDDQNFYLERLDYGNEDSVQYEYDDKGRILSATYEDGKTIEYTYDNSGRTATISDEASGTVSSFGYDYMDRVSVYTEENPDNKLTLSYSYYVANKKLKTLLEEINGHPRGASYVYDNDERLKSYQKANGKREYTYDDFDRVPSYVTSHKNTEGRFVTVLTTAFTFASSAVSTTSTRVASMRQESNGFTQDYSYTYDKNGNILSVTDPNGTTTYEYDSLGQLLRENNFAGNFTHVWVYDEAGNIESRTEYAYTTGELGTPINTVDYSYDDAEWGDLLTKYGDLEIKYDKIGNPESIGTSTLTWQHGRQLASLTSGETTWTYTYNADGLRTKRTDGTNTYEYVYYDGLLQYMEYNNTPVYFTHAPDGTPMGMLTGGNAYFYITNLQGDVVGIVDATGNLMVSYTYDAWGNPLTTILTSSSDSEVIENATKATAMNPFRYRGYEYDDETGLYYLQSRYYSPVCCRFLNGDTYYYCTGQGMDGNNMFIYCLNNPVCAVDYQGMDAIYVVDYKEGRGLPVVGHAYLYIQDAEGKWYKTELAGQFPDKDTAKVALQEVTDFSELNNMLKGKNINNLNYVYLEGDFSKSVKYAKKHEGSNYGGYNLATNNCMHYAQNVLLKGKFDNAIEKHFLETNPHVAPVDLYKRLVEAQWITILGNAVKKSWKVIVNMPRSWGWFDR